MERIFLVLLVANLNYSINVYEKGEFYMENTIMLILSILIQSITLTYFTTYYSKLIENIEYSTKNYILNFIFVLLAVVIRNINKRFITISKHHICMGNIIYRF